MSKVLVVGGGPTVERLVEQMRRHGHEIRIHPTTTVTGIDREKRRVLVHVNGSETACSYDTLVLATRARPLIPDIPGLVDSEGHLTEGIVALGSSADRARIAGDAVVVLGEGPLAVETASTLAAHSGSTTLVCTTPHPLYTRLGEVCSGMLSEQLAEAGVTVIGGKTVVSREPGKLRFEDGTALPADTLVLCTGAIPDTRLAREAGLDVHGGIVVDNQLRTSDPHIHAIGDCAEHDGQVMTGTNVAWEQAETLAELLTGGAATYRPSPSWLRLRTTAADVATIGHLADLHQPGTRLISLTDQVNRRYAHLALRDERVVAAVLFGLPQAIATIGLLHRRGQHLPSDRLGLLLGLPPRPASDSTAVNESAPICLCNSVSKQTLLQAWQAGSHTVTALAKTTRATTGCGGCSQSVAELCGVWARETRHEWEKAS
ncbi:NAD(P)/FAD-dependent oxidoreductase [Streptomyces sp. ISL-14]|nr:NAD(P)/FAD-dependent oxidoreductase [Streptomyces sp. ISL-14]